VGAGGHSASWRAPDTSAPSPGDAAPCRSGRTSGRI
jgi:hypothetical protein